MSSAECIRRFVELREPGKPFQLLGPLGGDRARLRFLGTFAGEETVWDARVMTLAAACRAALERGEPPPIGRRQFIEVGPDSEQGRRIDIGLHLPAIDEPTLWKTITMVRNYKRLRFGRIEWGGGPDSAA